MDPYKFVLADDHPLLRQGLKRILKERADMEVIAEASDGLELLNLLNRDKFKPQMIIADISMPKLRGIEAIPKIKALHPHVKIMILTMHRNKEYLCQAISSGADGYLLKEDAESELFAAIDTIRNGKIYVSPLLSEVIQEDWAKNCRAESKNDRAGENLTMREKEVLKLIAEGQTNQEIADLLFISVRTVEHHRANLMAKLSIRKTVELVKYAIDQGYIQ